jgi:hypothetical protein
MLQRQRIFFFIAAALFFVLAVNEVFDDGLNTKSILAGIVGGSLFGLGLLRGRQQL